MICSLVLHVVAPRARSLPHDGSVAISNPACAEAGGEGGLHRQEGTGRGSRITTAVSDDRSAA
jgi:hypothetical protein